MGQHKVIMAKTGNISYEWKLSNQSYHSDENWDYFMHNDSNWWVDIDGKWRASEFSDFITINVNLT